MATTAAPRQVDVTTLGLAASGTTIWRTGERIHVTVFTKASFEFVPDAAMRILPPEEILSAEVHHNKNPMRSVRLTPDVAPYLPFADVLLTGHACAPEGTVVAALSVRLAVFRGEALLDKTIHVHGDAKGDEIIPFDRMPLMYERAYGGIGWEENPLGAGYGAASSAKKPNLTDPLNPQKAACFAPISRGWPFRKRLLSGADRRALDRPIVEIPPSFDWSYFQAAPEDQRIGHLQGDEWIILDGVHPVHSHLQSYLPSARGLARVYGLADGGTGHPLTLVADTLRIDADLLRCSVVWRGSFPIPHEDALAAIRVVAGVETSVARLSWPATPQASPAAVDKAPKAAERVDHAATVALAPAEPEEVEVLEDVTDFARTLTTEDAPADEPKEPKWERTLLAEEDASSPSPSLPFVKGVALELPPEIPPELFKRPASTDTITLHDDADAEEPPKPQPPSLPFQRSPPPPPTAPHPPGTPQEKRPRDRGHQRHRARA